MNIVESVYALSSGFPRDEVYGLTSQIRRAAVSVPSNIAEGAARRTNKEFLQFLSFSLGSLAEVETQLLLAQRLGMADSVEDVLVSLASTRRLILGLARYLRK